MNTTTLRKTKSRSGTDRVDRPLRNGEHLSWDEFERLTDRPAQPATLRDLLEILPAGEPVPLDEVESWTSIVPRFVCTAMSLGALLLAAGTNGKRLALPNAKILIHQLSGGFEGQASDIEIQAREAIALKQRIEELISRHSGQPLEKVSRTWNATTS